MIDLRLRPPRSVRERFCGVAMLGRTIDKARAAAAGTLGAYEYDCPMDRAVFALLGIDAATLLDAVRAAPDDATLTAFIQPLVERVGAAEVDRWSTAYVAYRPAPESDSARRLRETAARLAPRRNDILTWADAIDLDEGRDVPPRG